MRHHSSVENVGWSLVAAAVHRLLTLLSDISADDGALRGGIHAAKCDKVMLEQSEPNEAATIRCARLLKS